MKALLINLGTVVGGSLIAKGIAIGVGAAADAVAKRRGSKKSKREN